MARTEPEDRCDSSLPEHLRAQRQNEREAVVPLHPADRDADQLAVAVQHAAARHAGMAIGQARDQIVRRPLADVAGREDDPLRVVVAEAEDRIREIEAVAEVRRSSAGRSIGSFTRTIAQSPGSTSTCASPASTTRAVIGASLVA